MVTRTATPDSVAAVAGIPGEPARIDPRLIASLASVYLIWSSTYLAMRIVVHDLPPLLSAAVRFLLAGSALFGYALYKGARVPALRDWLRVAPVGVFLFVGGNGFVSIASQSIPSGGVAVVCALMPLWVGVLGLGFGVRPTAREWLSLFIGFAGVVFLLGGPSLAGKPVHIVLVILSPMLWAAGSLLSRRTKDVGGDHAAFVGPSLQMLTGGLALGLLALVRGERFPLDAHATSWLALVYLFVFGSLVGFTAYAWLLRNTRPTIATSYAYINPILAVLIGAALYGEPLGWTTLIANILIVGAVMLALSGARHRV
ncbi:MAG TPA: EamA family transporter [Kofleriaceae bacterium]|nr:EamA family transporter [Kofleriaceae bacterium]